MVLVKVLLLYSVVTATSDTGRLVLTSLQCPDDTKMVATSGVEVMGRYLPAVLPCDKRKDDAWA